MLRRLSKALGEEEQARLLAKADGLSPKGEKKLNDTLDEHHCIISRKTPEMRLQLLEKFIDEKLAVYPVGSDDSRNLYTESVRKRVVQVDKRTGQVVAIHEGIRAAWKATGVYHGTISNICNHTGKGGQKGYKSAGGCYWYFEEEWNEMQKNKEQASVE